MRLPLRVVRPEKFRETVLLALILVIFVIFGQVIENFYTARTFDRITQGVTVIAIISVGQALVIITKNIDLSVGAIAGFCAFFAGLCLVGGDLNPGVTVLMAVTIGAGLGAINGILISVTRVPSIIVTLGTMAIFRGMLVDLSGGRTVTSEHLPPWISDLPRSYIFEAGPFRISTLFVIALGVVFGVHLLMSYSRRCRQIYAIGSNPEAAKLLALPSKRITFFVFMLSGAFAGLAGFVMIARFGNITVEAGAGFELASIAAVVVGGVNIFGGSGTILGAFLGALLVAVLEQGLFRLNIGEFWRDALLGLLILAAVVSDKVLVRRLKQAWDRQNVMKEVRHAS